VPKDPAPYGFNVAKGSTHMAVTRAFVEFAVSDARALGLLDWMSDIRVPDDQPQSTDEYTWIFHRSKYPSYIAINLDY